jgi:hypothetical protein
MRDLIQSESFRNLSTGQQKQEITENLMASKPWFPPAPVLPPAPVPPSILPPAPGPAPAPPSVQPPAGDLTSEQREELLKIREEATRIFNSARRYGDSKWRRDALQDLVKSYYTLERKFPRSGHPEVNQAKQNILKMILTLDPDYQVASIRPASTGRPAGASLEA